MRGLLRDARTPLTLGIALWLAWLLSLPPRPSEWLVFGTGLPWLVLVSWLAARRAGTQWASFVRRTADVHTLGVVLLYGFGLQWADSHGITTDGVTYFAQLRSVLFDGDLAIADEYGYLGQPTRPGYFVPIGPTLLWLPAYLVVAAVDWLGRSVGAWSPPADPIALGLTLPYVRIVSLSSYAIAAAGLVALLRYIGREFRRSIAFVATLLIFGATPLFWYMVYEPSMTHAPSFGFVALFAVACGAWVPHEITPRRSAVLGALAAMAFLVRPQEALIVLLPAFLIAAAPGSWPSRVQKGLALLKWAAVAAVPWLLLQIVHAWVLYHANDFAFFGAQGGYLDPLHSRWADTLFSSWHGFLSWTPIAYVAVIGTFAYFRRNRAWAAAAIAILLLMAWVNGSTADWGAGWSFGGRRFVSTLALLAPGLALTVDFLRRRPLAAIAPLAVMALWWNYLLMVQYTVGMLPKDEPVSFGRIIRQQADVYTRSPYIYPFAFPANVWFAWRTGLPAERYDLLASEPLHSALDVTFDGRAERFLLDGWEGPGGDDWGSSWWIGGTPAVIALPLDLPADRPIDIEVRARTRYEEPAFEARLALEINGVPIGEFLAAAAEPSTARFTVPPERFRHVWRPGYNHLAFRSLGVTPVDPSDPRPPGPLARRSERRPWPVAIYDIRIKPRENTTGSHR